MSSIVQIVSAVNPNLFANSVLVSFLVVEPER
nr:MAG TPA: hypothetical protein [Caudoviricetes sp.]